MDDLIKNVTMRDIVKLVNVKDAQNAFRYFYGNLDDTEYWAKKNVPVAFKRILNAPKKKQKNPVERIEIYAGSYLEDAWDKKGKVINGKKELNSTYGIHTIELGTVEYNIDGREYPKTWSLSFRGWDELSNVLIGESTLEHYTLVDMLAHFIWEITWHGMEDEMKKKGDELMKNVKESMKDIKKQAKKNPAKAPGKSLDEVFKKLSKSKK